MKKISGLMENIFLDERYSKYLNRELAQLLEIKDQILDIKKNNNNNYEKQEISKN